MKSLVLLFTALVGTCSVLAQSASLTFQGQLGDSGRPASGNYDFVFRLFDAAANGSEVALSFAAPNVVVTNGYFTAQVDFGANAFAGGARWVQVEVRTNGSVAAFSPLLPRQALGAVPYALYALNGSPGPQGSAGPQGPQGALGPAGATGPQGSQGLLGLTGAAGPAGVVGPQGPKGLVFRGAWNPATSYVLDDAVASGGSAWLAKRGNSNITPIEGADWTLLSQKGDAGTAGPAGPQGLQGVLGATGLTGATGPQGIQGGQGLTGATGPQGPAGGVDMTLATNFALLNVPDTSIPATATATVTAGFITGITVTGAGNGYTLPPTISITDATGTGAVLAPLIAGGRVIGATVANAGSGYTSPTVQIAVPPPHRKQVLLGDNDFFGNNHFRGQFTGNATGLTNFTGLESRFVQLETLVEQAIFSSELAKANLTASTSSGTFSEFLTDQDGFYNSLSTNTLFLAGGDFYANGVNRVFSGGALQINQVFTGTQQINAPLRFVRFTFLSNVAYNSSATSTLELTVNYGDGTQATTNLAISFGAYSQGQSQTRYIPSSKPATTVTSIGWRLTHGFSGTVEVEIWDNSERMIVGSVPAGFLQPGHEVKLIPAFRTKEDGGAVASSLTGAWGELALLNGQWVVLPGAVSSTNSQVEIRYTSPTSVSTTSFTKPTGFVLMKRPL